MQIFQLCFLKDRKNLMFRINLNVWRHRTGKRVGANKASDYYIATYDIEVKSHVFISKEPPVYLYLKMFVYPIKNQEQIRY